MKPLKYNEFYRTVLLLGRRHGLPIPPDDTEPRCITNLHVFYEIITFIFMSYKIFCAVMAIMFVDLTFAELVMDCGTIPITLLLSICLQIFYRFQRRGFISLINTLDHVSESIINGNLGRQAEFRRGYERDAKLVSKMTVVLAVMTVSCAALVTFSVLVIGLLTGTYGQKTPQRNHCPFEGKGPGLYEYITITQFLSLVYCGNLKLVHEFIMFGMLKTQTHFFRYLSEILSQIGKDILSGREEDKAKLIQWIKLHQAVINSARDLTTFFSPVIILYYMVIITLVAGGLFYGLNAKGENALQITAVGTYMLITILYLLLQCYAAEELTTEAAKVAETAYSLPWYELAGEEKEAIRLVICATGKGINVDAYRSPVFRLNRESFQSFMASTVSAYMGFNTISEVHQK